ncbi:MAG: PLP-dependent lyase/thiolase [Bacillales bacterium]|jgi:diaminopropionate ammonia-lyase|nr:PLP-dependent lyase/thiolase [Bacillales bacterium]
MNSKMNIVLNKKDENLTVDCSMFDMDAAEKAIKFHESFPGYQRTPLANLENLAKALNVSGIFVKDESYRFGINAFKALGGSFAIGKYLANMLQINIEDLNYETMSSERFKKRLENVTFITATDGNHGRGVAWTTNRLQLKSIVYMPKGSSKERLINILAEGASASITDLNYDDAVIKAAEDAEKNNYVLLQDTAWEGYEEIPEWIMQGYLTMAVEAYNQLKELEEMPTHIFLQAGVGSMAAAMAGFFAQIYENVKIIIVEPNKADCVFRTAKADDGKLHYVADDMNTIMAGLACGRVSTIAWPILKKYAKAFLSVSDVYSADGMRILGAPLGNDMRVISGESGAVGIGTLAAIMTKSEHEEIRYELELNNSSKVLFFSTEGDTDKENYRKIVWNGAYSGMDK